MKTGVETIIHDKQKSLIHLNKTKLKFCLSAYLPNYKFIQSKLTAENLCLSTLFPVPSNVIVFFRKLQVRLIYL